MEHTEAVCSMLPLPRGRLASASEDCSVRVWAIHTGKCEVARMGHNDAVRGLGMMPDGRIVSGSDDCTVRVWC